MSAQHGKWPVAAGARATVAAVAVGGALGAALRWGLELALGTDGWPWATLLVNVLGCAALAVLVTRAAPRRPWLRAGVGTGLLGGFTTFSTYAVQVAALAGGAPALALLYAVATPLLCVGAAALASGASLRWGPVATEEGLR